MEKLEDLISNLEQFKELKTVPIDQLLIDLSLIKEEFKQQLSMRVVGSSLDLGTISIDKPDWGNYGFELMFKGERGYESTFLDKDQALKIIDFLNNYL